MAAEPNESMDLIEESADDHKAVDNGEDNKAVDKEESADTVKLHQLPLGRVKNIMKMDPDVNMASQDAVFLVTKAIELFIESLAVEAYGYTKKKTVARQDVEKAIDSVDALAFLEGAMDD